MGTVITGMLVLAIVGGIFAFVSMQNKKKRAAAASWPSAPGVITVSQVSRDIERDADGTVSHSYTPNVAYTYAVDGVEHQGKRIAFANTRSGNSKKPRAGATAIPWVRP